MEAGERVRRLLRGLSKAILTYEHSSCAVTIEQGEESPRFSDRSDRKVHKSWTRLQGPVRFGGGFGLAGTARALTVPGMSQEPVEFYHRGRRERLEEQVPGEAWLRWLYSSSISGRVALHVLAKRALCSWWYGRKMDHPRSVHKVLPFIVEHDLDVDEFAKQAMAYKTFNEFFYRALKPSARPIDANPRSAVLPADGRHLVFPDVDAADGFYVKGERFDLGELIGGAHTARQFAGGAMLISRLAPVDYHRFHFPCAGTPGRASEIKGLLYSVNPIALRRNIRYLVQNKRMVTLLDSELFGTVAMIEVGATMVGAIRQTFIPATKVKKGEEKGLFKFGGSCVITLFQKGRIVFDDDLRRHSAGQVETYAKMGERLGVAP